MNLPSGWYTLEIAPGVNPFEPGIAQWEIDGAGSYETPYSDAGRMSREAGRHILRLQEGKPWRGGDPEGHPERIRALAAAHADGRKIKLLILRNTGDGPEGDGG